MQLSLLARAIVTVIAREHHTSVSDLFLIQQKVNLSAVVHEFDNAIGHDENITSNHTFQRGTSVVDDVYVRNIALWVPLGLIAFGFMGYLLDRYVFDSDGHWKTVFLLILLGGMNVGSYVGHAQIIKVEPRITEVHPYAMTMFANCSVCLFLPIGLFLRGFAEAREIFWSSGLLAVVILLVWSLFNLSLSYLAVTSFMILYQISPLMLYPGQVAFLGDTFTFTKALAVLFSWVGFVIILANKKSNVDGVAENQAGYLIGMFAVFVYAAYQILFLRLFQREGKSFGDWISFLFLFYGVRGCWCVLLSLVAIGGYALCGFTIQLGDGFPTTNEIWAMCGGTLCFWIYLFVCVTAWAKFSPTWVATAMAFQIPVSLFLDSTYNEFTMSFWTMFGTVVILVSFGVFTYAKHFGKGGIVVQPMDGGA